jgi:hypothetical protein
MGSVITKSNHVSERTNELLDRVDYRLAETEFQKDEIYRLRYRAYLQEGAIEPRVDQRLTDRFDDMPNSWIFGIHVDGVLASSLRISVASPAQPETPAVAAFGDLLKPEIAKGKVIVDPNRFVADTIQSRRVPELPYITLRLAYLACAYFNADIGTATVRKEHEAFYRRVFLHESLCEPRPYPTLIKPLGLMAVNFRDKRDQVFQRYPLFRSSFRERRKLFGRREKFTAEAESFRLTGPEPDLGVIALPEFPFCRSPLAPAC